MQTQIKTAPEIKAMRISGGILASVLATLRDELEPGMTSKALAIRAAQEVKALGGKPAFLGYQGFPDVICISINEEIVHGIPSPFRIIKDGDLVGLDFGVVYDGMTTDGAITVIAGRPKQKGHIRLVDRTAEALRIGIDAVHDKVRTGDIGAAIEGYLKQYQYGIVRDLVGHGVGHHLHEDPNIPNYGRAGSGPWLEKGMTIAIEPMVTLGTDKIVQAEDGWTIRSADGSYAAHFEHTVLITEEGAEILTVVRS